MPSPEQTMEPTDVLSPQNTGIFEKMSAGGKVIASGIYEGLKNVPGAKWLVSKIGIAYNEKRMFGQEQKASKLKAELDTLSIKNTQLEASKRAIETLADRLEQKNIPGSEAVRLGLRKIDSEISNLQNRQDTVQSKIEAKNNKIAIFANKRDAIADKMIGHYAEKLAPLEENVAQLETSRDQLDLVISVARAGHAQQQIRITDIEREKESLESLLRDSGMSASQIKNQQGVRVLEEEIAIGRKSIRSDEEEISKRKIAVDKKIAKADAKANPHRDNRDDFVRVKQGRPIEIKLTERTREIDGDAYEQVSSNTRPENLNIIENPEGSYDYAQEAEAVERRPAFTMQSAVLNWNQYLSTLKDQDEARALRVDQNQFLLATRSSADGVLGVENFKQVFASYLKYKKVATLGTNTTIDTFLTAITTSN